MDWIGLRKTWYAVSLLLIIAGLISLGIRGLNLGIDFTGGNIIQLRFEQDVPVGQLRESLNREVGGGSVQSAGEKQFLVRTAELSEGESDDLLDSLDKEFGKVTVLRNEKVGAVIGRELTRNAFYALVIASLLIIVYITLRFQFKSGLAAITALLHDVLVTLGVFSLFQIEIDSTFVAAVLTIIGYSINDTIVVFDRIRENIGFARREGLAAVFNKSISQTLFRSISTALTVIMALVALLVLGGETTKLFALAMLIGTISGTYSSICVASPLWFDFSGGKNRGRMSGAGGGESVSVTGGKPDQATSVVPPVVDNSARGTGDTRLPSPKAAGSRAQRKKEGNGGRRQAPGQGNRQQRHK